MYYGSRVLRIEHFQSKLGPYINFKGRDKNELLSSTKKINKPLSPLDDKLLTECNISIVKKAQRLKTSVSCFKNLSHLKKWFTNEELTILHELGYTLRVYETPRENIVFFKKQAVVLNKDTLDLLWTQSLLHLVY